MMLYVMFQLGDDRFALEARRVVEVLPLLALKKIPQSPKGVAGIFIYRGRPVPALDLCELTYNRPARERLSTRIIVINCGAGEERDIRNKTCQETGAERQANLTPDTPHRAPSLTTTPAPDTTQLLGLIAERATETMRRDAKEFVESGIKLATTPFLGPVLIDTKGVVQLLHVEKLSLENLRDLVFAPAENQSKV